ncbi:MAG: phosphoribosylglycinamide formyltransferase [Candidatus Makaraimicrobium thalassicum]|nr:MAG: phosphoribosylglycinamide formyltransferase [Candidatus Omnitrophota bacterium]
MNIAVFVSGNGSNLQALIDAEAKGDLGAGRIVLVVSDNPGAFALERARKAGIRIFVLEPGGARSRDGYDERISRELKEDKIELIVLAGFMRILGKPLVEGYKGRILNIHPALLPSFKGVHGIKDAFEYGVKTTGVTAHFVTEELDAGPVILQSNVSINGDDTLDTLEEKIHREEHRLYPEAVRLFVQGRLRIEGRKVRILDKKQ